MSAPVLLACGALTLALALPVVGAAEALAVRQRLQGAVDNAALAAADAATGWIDAVPCELASRVVRETGGQLLDCELDELTGTVRVHASARTMLGTAQARARAGPPVT